MRRPLAGVAAAVLTTAAGCGISMPNSDPPWAEKQRQVDAERDATDKRELEELNARVAEAKEEFAPQLAAFKRLAARAKALAPAKVGINESVAADAPRIAGRVLIWDGEANEPSEAQYRLPPDVRAVDPTGRVAVHYVVKKHKRYTQSNFTSVWAYGSGGKPGVTIGSEVCSIEFPAGKVRPVEGPRPLAWVDGTHPGAKDARRQWEGATEIMGDWPQGLADWAEKGYWGRARPGSGKDKKN